MAQNFYITYGEWQNRKIKSVNWMKLIKYPHDIEYETGPL